MSEPSGIGILGCGNISAAYMQLGPLFRDLSVRACADLRPEAAQARADEYGLRAETVDGLLAAPDVDIVVNLTVPSAHFETSKAILQAGKHVYSEKPYVLTLEQAVELTELARSAGRRIGSAPDTFLGGAHQLARKLIDDGRLGKVTSGTAHVLSHGMEHWHPAPDFFYQYGAGPVLDVGPYYVTNLVQLIGPVKRVMAMTATPASHRTITSEPRAGELVPVGTPTTIHALLEFASGAVVTLGASWDVWAHRHHEMELYGEDGSLFVPDPNWFGGTPLLTAREEAAETGDWDHPLSVANDRKHPEKANYRGIGLADMAAAIAEGRDHRCDHRLATHVVEVMTAILAAGETGTARRMETTCDRPAPLSPEEARALLA